MSIQDAIDAVKKKQELLKKKQTPSEGGSQLPLQKKKTRAPPKNHPELKEHDLLIKAQILIQIIADYQCFNNKRNSKWGKQAREWLERVSNILL